MTHQYFGRRYTADLTPEQVYKATRTDATRAAYARADLLPMRARLLEDWAQFCAEPFVEAGEVVQLRGAA